jgi:lysophospholipase L1-like esterase
LFAALSPLLLLQSRYVRHVTVRLPEPPGPRTGDRGTGARLRVLIVGDSAAAGVGASSQEAALSGQLVTALATTHRVTWSLIAKSGATTLRTASHLSRLPPESFDIAVVSLGGNDVTAHRNISKWIGDVTTLATVLRTRFAVRLVVFSGLPPIHAFPALPQPLRWYLGTRARAYDAALAEWAASQPDCEYVALRLPADGDLFAVDGMHPGPRGYHRWSIELAQRIRVRSDDVAQS